MRFPSRQSREWLFDAPSFLPEALLFAVEKSLHVRPVPPYDDPSDKYRKWKQTRARQHPEMQIADHEKRKRNGCPDRGDRNVAGDLKKEKPNRQDGKDSDWHEPKKDASRCCDAFSATKTEPDRKGVAKDTGQSPGDPDQVALRVAYDQGTADYKSDPDGSEALECIKRKNQIPPFFPQYPEDIGCADIAAPVLADIDSPGARNEMAVGAGTQEIANASRKQVG